MQVNLLLQQANAAPKVSAWAYLSGPHDFNWHPLAPLGIGVHIYIPPDKRKTWGVKSKKGFYVRTLTEHYQYYDAFCSETEAVQGSETMYFKHKYISSPTVTPADSIVQAARELADALREKTAPPLTQSVIDELRNLNNIFTETADSQQNEMMGEENNSPMNSPRIAPTEGAPQSRVNIIQPDKLIVASQIAEAAKRSARSSLPSWMKDYALKIAKEVPANNTRAKRRQKSITDEVMLASIEMSNSRIDARQAAGRKYPLQLLCEIAGAVIDANTGKLLKYRHLIRRPEYQEI
jgi:hypothetical protein